MFEELFKSPAWRNAFDLMEAASQLENRVTAEPVYQLVNLTPHAIVLQIDDETLSVPPAASGPARLKTAPSGLNSIKVEGLAGSVPVAGKPQYGPIEGLPEPQPGVLYIVSALVGAVLGSRDDVVMPGTGPNDGAIRENGQVKAVTRLVRAG